MNYRMILSLLGKVLLLLAVFLLLPCGVALIYKEGDFLSLITTCGLSALLGGLLCLLQPKKQIMACFSQCQMSILCKYLSIFVW